MNLKFIKAIITSCCLVIATSVSMPAFSSNFVENNYLSQTKDKTFLHTVAKGETVYSIAKMYNVSVSDIYSLNPKAASALKMGENLIVPQKNTKSAKAQTTSKSEDLGGYKVKSKETLYSISKQFNVTVDDIVNANPSLKTTPLQEGDVLQIPGKVPMIRLEPSHPVTPKSQFVEHKVQPKETIYGIAKQYNVTPEALTDFNPELKSGLKQGASIIIPVLENTPNNATSPVTQVGGSTLTDINAIKIGVVLPFLNKSEGQSARFLEYYEGFLLALQDMKEKGFSANVYVFDMGSETGTAKLKSLLDTYEMKNLDLIVGGVSPEQVAIISNFAQKQGIKYAVPFPTKTEVALSNNRVFQVNGTHSLLISGVVDAFANRFSGANVIFVTSNTINNDKKDLVTQLSLRLASSGVSSKTIIANQSLTSSLSSALDYNRKNIIVPASGSVSMLQVLMPALNSVTTEHPSASISLFGHTEWQTYNQFFSDYNKYDTYIYTPFYLSEGDVDTRQFMSKYKKWYNNKSLINTYPKYGALGYDTGMYFLTALSKYGKNFENSNNSVRTLQTPFFFNKTSAVGGYMNTGFYFIHYNTNGSVDKIEYAK